MHLVGFTVEKDRCYSQTALISWFYLSLQISAAH